MEQRIIAQNRVGGRCSLNSVRGCLRVRGCLIAVCLFASLVLLLVDDSNALPPDFFRVGRAHLGSSSSSHWKRAPESIGGGGGVPSSFGGMRLAAAAVSDDDVLSVVCGYCANTLGPNVGAACQSANSADSRRLCTESFLRDMRAFILVDE